jgi:hypothetical protein
MAHCIAQEHNAHIGVVQEASIGVSTGFFSASFAFVSFVLCNSSGYVHSQAG